MQFSEVDILLATFESAEFVGGAVESVMAQSCGDWRLLVRDGGSRDATVEIIERYAREYPHKIELLESNGAASALENFSALLTASSAPYVMFCDHDDVWLPGKVAKTLEAAVQAEEQSGKDTPLLVFTDKQVVDADLSVISDSYFSYQNLDPHKLSPGRLLVQNVPSGCTILINRALADLCGPIPAEAVMHDHWLTLIAATMGRIVYVDEPTILYRQHEGNVYGASQYGWGFFADRLSRGVGAARERFYQNVRQAKAFLDRYQSHLAAEDVEILQAFSQLEQQGWMARRRTILKYGIYKTGLRRNLGMLLTI